MEESRWDNIEGGIGMTVGDLRGALEGWPADTPVVLSGELIGYWCIPDEAHGEDGVLVLTAERHWIENARPEGSRFR